MIMNAYSIFDTKALHYHLPFFSPNDAVAIRLMGDLVNDPQSRIAQHPADYVLYRVGLYDDATGGVQPLSPLVHVIDAVALVRVQPSLFDVPKGAPTEEQVAHFQRAINGEAK